MGVKFTDMAKGVTLSNRLVRSFPQGALLSGALNKLYDEFVACDMDLLPDGNC